MLRQLSSKGQGRKDFWKPSKPCHVGILWIALTEYPQMSTHVPGFQSFSVFLHHFVLAKLTTSSRRVKSVLFHWILTPKYRQCITSNAELQKMVPYKLEVLWLFSPNLSCRGLYKAYIMQYRKPCGIHLSHKKFEQNNNKTLGTNKAVSATSWQRSGKLKEKKHFIIRLN